MAIWIVCALVALLAVRWLRLADRLYYVPDPVLRDLVPAAAGVSSEEITIKTADGLALPGWVLLARTTRRGIVLHLHGNAANRANHWPLVSFLPEAGFDVIVFDYRGYGGAPSHPSRAGLHADGEAALAFALARAAGRVPVLLFGQSLGGAGALVLAADHSSEIAGVVAEAPFTSHQAIAGEVLRGLLLVPPLANALAWLLVSSGLDPEDACDRIVCPVLLIHGTRDPVVPAHMSRELAARLDGRAELALIEGGAHLDLLDHGKVYTARVVDFLERCVVSRERR
jgi:pimeloyl-ACP methyl ester carboxylesterase